MPRYIELLLLTTLVVRVAAQSNAESSLTFLFQNNLNATDDANHVGAILLDPTDYASGVRQCGALNEKPLPWSTILTHQSDFQSQFNYLAYSGIVSSMVQAYWIDNSAALVTASPQLLLQQPKVLFSRQKLPFLCTQSALQDQADDFNSAALRMTSVNAAGNSYTGYRNNKSFRFLGIRYASRPERFTYSLPYTETGRNLTALKYGAECLQFGSGSEDCLFMNIQTPYLPKSGSKDRLRPVIFWIHGGGFVGGSGADPGTDGGNLASREDIVVVNINYRLNTLGFFAVPGTDVKGNFGIGDQISALQWVVDHIANFGGDPQKITISGESAGAGSVRALLGSLPVIGKFQGAIAMSNLGGDVDLGMSSAYGTTYSSYLTVNESFVIAGEQIFNEAGCTQSTFEEQIACLRAYPGDITSFNYTARYVVQDGHIVNTEELELQSKNANTANVNVVFGVAANDGASFLAYSRNCTSEVTCLTANMAISENYAQSIIDSGLFPYYDTGNITADSFNVSQRVIQDNTFRCVDQATVYAGATSGAFKSSYFYQMDRTVSGYNPVAVDGSGPVTLGYPLGNPNLPYYRLHGSDLPWAFGNLDTYRDANDLYSIQVTAAYFGAFVRTGDPNPPERYLELRGYSKVLDAVRQTGRWDKVSGINGPIRLMDYPPAASGFIDVPQCEFLNYSLSYYLEGGS